MAQSSSQAQQIAIDFSKSIQQAQKGFGTFGKETSKSSKSLVKDLLTLQGTMDVLKASSNKLGGMVGVGGVLSFGGLIKGAHDLNQQLSGMKDGLVVLTDASTSAGDALGMAMSASRLGSVDQMKSAMNAAAEAGMTLGDNMGAMAQEMADIEQMMGISAGTTAKMMKVMSNVGGVEKTRKSIRLFTSDIMALGFNGRTTEAIMSQTTETIKKVGVFGSVSGSRMRDMNQSVSRSIGVMKKLGISADEAGQFIDGMLDPEKFDENFALMSKLGLSYQEYSKMLTSDDGPTMFMDKMLKKLPDISRQMQGIADPIQRMNYAKSFGLPMNIAQKMANTTAGKIGATIEEIKKAQKDEEAIKKKEAKSKANQAKWDDAMLQLKMKALAPIMKMLKGDVMGTFWKALNLAAKTVAKFASLVAKILVKILPTLQKFLIALDFLIDGEFTNFSRQIGATFQGAGELLKELIVAGWKEVVEIFTWENIKKGFSGLNDLIDNTIGKFVGGAAGSEGAGKVAATGAKIAGGLFVAKQLRDVYRGMRYGKDAKPIDIHRNKVLKKIEKNTNTGTSGGMGKLLGKNSMLNKMIRKLPGGDKLARLVNVAGKGGIGRAGLGGKGLGKGAQLLGKGALKSIGAVSRLAGPIGIAVSALLGGIEGFTSAEDYFKEEVAKSGMESATGTQKAASGLAGAGTLGIGPLIDNIFGTQVTPAIAKGLVSVSESTFGKFLGLDVVLGALGGTIEAFSDDTLHDSAKKEIEMLKERGVLGEKEMARLTFLESLDGKKSADIQAEMDALEQKLLLGEELSTEDRKRYNQLNILEADSKKTFIEGYRAWWNNAIEGIKNYFIELKDRFMSIIKVVTDIFTGPESFVEKLKTLGGKIWDGVYDNFLAPIGRAFKKLYYWLTDPMYLFFKELGLMWDSVAYQVEEALRGTGFGSGRTKEEIAKDMEKVERAQKNLSRVSAAEGKKTATAQIAALGQSLSGVQDEGTRQYIMRQIANLREESKAEKEEAKKKQKKKEKKDDDRNKSLAGMGKTLKDIKKQGEKPQTIQGQVSDFIDYADLVSVRTL